MPHFMIVLLPYINLLNLSWIKMSIFEEYEAFKGFRNYSKDFILLRQCSEYPQNIVWCKTSRKHKLSSN